MKLKCVESGVSESGKNAAKFESREEAQGLEEGEGEILASLSVEATGDTADEFKVGKNYVVTFAEVPDAEPVGA